MEYEPRFWWSECESEHGGKFPLICHRCCNNLRRQGAQGKSIRGAPAPTLPCFICQKIGMLVSQSTRGGAVARVKETKIPHPTTSSKSTHNKATQLPTGERWNINIKRNMKCNDDATTVGESEDETPSTISSANSRWCEAAT